MNIETTIIEIISKVSYSEISDIHLQSYFFRDFKFSFFEFTQMLYLIEEEFKFKFSAIDDVKINTVEELIKLLG